MTSVNEFFGRLRGVRKSGNGWIACCPAHDDRKASLSISVDGRATKILVHCHAGCQPEAICSAAGIDIRDLFLDQDVTARASKVARKVVARFSYVDEGGSVLFEVQRFSPKGFSQRRPDGQGGWINNLDGVRRVLYHLPEVIAAKQVIVTEGEKDVETARSIGFVATCNAGGAGKWRDEYAEFLHGKHVVVIPDADEPGRKHGQHVAASLIGKAASLKLFEMPCVKDLSEWVERGGTREQFEKLVASAPEWTPPYGSIFFV